MQWRVFTPRICCRLRIGFVPRRRIAQHPALPNWLRSRPAHSASFSRADTSAARLPPSPGTRPEGRGEGLTRHRPSDWLRSTPAHVTRHRRAQSRAPAAATAPLRQRDPADSYCEHLPYRRACCQAEFRNGLIPSPPQGIIGCQHANRRAGQDTYQVIHRRGAASTRSNVYSSSASKDPDARAIVRARVGSMGRSPLRPTCGNCPSPQPTIPTRKRNGWDEELKLLEDTIDRRTDLIYMWVCIGGSMIRWAIGEGGE